MLVRGVMADDFYAEEDEAVRISYCRAIAVLQAADVGPWKRPWLRSRAIWTHLRRLTFMDTARKYIPPAK